MNCIVNKKDLVKAIKKAKAVAQKKGAMDFHRFCRISAKYSGIEIAVTDLNNYLKINLDANIVEENNSTVVVNLFDLDNVVKASKGKEIHIVGFMVNGIPIESMTEEFPTFPFAEEFPNYSIYFANLKKDLAKIVPAMSNDESRLADNPAGAVTGLLIKDDSFTATDGHLLVHNRYFTESNTDTKDLSIVVHGDSVRILNKIIANDERINLKVFSDDLSFWGNDFNLFVKGFKDQVVQDFPNYDRLVFDKSRSGLNSCTIYPNQIIPILEKFLKVVVAEARNHAIEITFCCENNRGFVMGRNKQAVEVKESFDLTCFHSADIDKTVDYVNGFNAELLLVVLKAVEGTTIARWNDVRDQLQLESYDNLALVMPVRR